MVPHELGNAARLDDGDDAVDRKMAVTRSAPHIYAARWGYQQVAVQPRQSAHDPAYGEIVVRGDEDRRASIGVADDHQTRCDRVGCGAQHVEEEVLRQLAD